MRDHDARRTQQAIREGPAFAVERSLGALLRKHGHLEDHHGKNRGLSSSQTPTSNCETREAAGTQHHAPRNRDAAPDLEDRAVPRMARPASRFLRAVPAIIESLLPGVVFARRIRETL